MKTSDIKCKRCGKRGPTAIYRLSPKGQTFEGACRACLTPDEWHRVSPEQKQLTRILEGK